jgi:hypothetical protein
MLVVLWPGSWLVLLPVIVVEALVARRLLHLEFRESLKLSAVANLWSTLVGIPMTWCVLLLLGLIAKPLEIFAEGLGADQLGWVLAAPIYATRAVHARHVPWQSLCGAAGLCVPFMAIAIRVEAWSARRRVGHKAALRWARAANWLTYVPIIVVLTLAASLAYLGI